MPLNICIGLCLTCLRPRKIENTISNHDSYHFNGAERISSYNNNNNNDIADNVYGAVIMT